MKILPYASITLSYFTSFIPILTLTETPPLLIVSFDGFRWDYFNRTATPHFDLLMSEGARAEWIENAYITKTFPNHFTIATGLYEESHGVVANEFYDPQLNRSFTPEESDDDAMFDSFGAKPIWVTAQEQDRRSGCFFWVGCEAKIAGYRPDIYEPYERDLAFSKRINAVVQWLAGRGKADGKAVNLALLYFNQPDAFGHEYGPESKEVTDEIKVIDDVVGEIRGKLECVGLWGKVNVLLTSDHGMASMDCTDRSKIIRLSDYVHVEDYMFRSGQPVTHVWNKTSGGIETLMEKLKSVEHIHVYKKEDVPNDFHYRKNRRIAPVLIESDEGYFVAQKDYSECATSGYHGFNNSYKDMHPFFIGVGPDFKNGSTVKFFSNVDIYPLMCELLGLEPDPNNGSLDVVKALIHEARASVNLTLPIDESVVEKCTPGKNTHYLALLVSVIGGILVVLVICAAIYYRCYHRGSVRASELQTRYNRVNSDESDSTDILLSAANHPHYEQVEPGARHS